MDSIDIRLDGRVVLVTGAASGIGLGIARHCIAQGAVVYLTDVEEVALARNAGALGANACARRMDVCDAGEVERVVTEIIDTRGGIDVLVNNAGVVAQGSYAETLEPAWQKLLAVNLTGVYHCVQAVAGSMRQRQRGVIINLASVSAMRGGGSIGNVWYGATKAAVVSITKGLARELGADGVRVNAIAPGVIETEMVKTALTPEVRQRVLTRFPLQRLATVEDVARATVFLASDAASFITGQTLAVDGGFLTS
ncbi:SDR family NAD(P)-dependent oxidoreductase [Trinickia mobilis]|uniref:SDR family NAD(P)-dependent oxidoreductase n=1 Tax=Trinickia mobilis TaxID=2816356 RepID=UPI001A8E8DA1|nr:SDR family oxidoreductase [Trinickia mobilis]